MGCVCDCLPCDCLPIGKKAKRGLSRKDPKNEEKISHVERALVELRETEITYGEALQYMVDKHLETLRKEAYFDQTDLIALNILFIELNENQKKFQKRLTQIVRGPVLCPDDNISDMVCKVSDIFTEAEEDYFQTYGRYVRCMSKVQKIISKSEGIEKIANLLEAKHNEALKSDVPKDFLILTIESIIIKPFQRLLLYPLILERIEKKCEDGTVEKEKVQSKN
ncbi:unnamed protein product [Orchesella dallaii]|uniref:DH domain-containing protein n=1 Tax=Orchesella dallaii TaxID=48710 RepID=A0ABP1QH05_9HEXA